MKLLSGSILILLLVLGGIARGEMYRYVDDQGVLHFVESLSDVPKKHRRKAALAGEEGNVSYSDPAPVRKRPQYQESGNLQSKRPFAGTVEMYVTSWCPACKTALKYVNEHGIAYAAYDIEKDSDAKRRYDGYSGRGVPLIVVGDKTMRGFNAATLEKWLGRDH